MNADLVMTVEEMKDEKKWLEVRNTGLGGSDAATVAGINKWKSPLMLWLEKTGRAEPEDLSKNERVYWGKKNEANIAEWFEEQTGKKAVRKGLMRSKEYPFALATVDRMVVGENAGLEIKTAGVDQSKNWNEDEIPDTYYCQCQWYMAVTDCDYWYIAVLIGGNKAIWKRVERNQSDIDNLIELGRAFWEKVKTRTKPDDIDGTESCSNALQKYYKDAGTTVNLSPSVYDLISDYDQSKQLADLSKEALEKAKNALKNVLGNNEVGILGDRKITWRTQNGKVMLDAKKLKAEMPKIYEKYSKTSEATRVLRVK